MPFDANHSDSVNKPLANKATVEDSSRCAAEQPEFELSLPDDLQLLAEQLSEDALHLSALYPPRAPDNWIQHSLVAVHPTETADLAPPTGNTTSSGRSSKRIVGSIAAAGVLIAATLAWQLTRIDSAPHAEQVRPRDVPEVTFAKHSLQQSAANEAKKAAAKELSAFHPTTETPRVSGRVVGTPQVENAMVPAGLFLTLTGPEQEAMLDLIQEAKLEQPSVSF